MPGNIGIRQNRFKETGTAETRERAHVLGGREEGEWVRQDGDKLEALQNAILSSPHPQGPPPLTPYATDTHTNTGLFSVFPTLFNHTAQKILREHLILVSKLV